MQASATQRRLILGLLLALGVAFLVVALTQEGTLNLGVLRRMELATLDARFALRGPNPVAQDSSHVVIVEIAEDSFRSLPEKFPWPRSYYARVVRNLYAAGARVVAIDLIFSDADNRTTGEDDSLRQAIRDTRCVVLAGKREEDRPGIITASQNETFGNIFFDTDSALGLVNIRPDADGIYRLYNTAFAVDLAHGDTRYIPTFGFAILNQYLGLLPGTTPVPNSNGFQYAGTQIPRYDPASLLLNLYGPHRSFPHYKFQDVIDDSTFTTIEEHETGEQINTFSEPEYGYLHDGTFKDKIVLIGVTVPEYKDIFPVAMGAGERTGDNLMYGVELHANLVESVLRKAFLQMQSTASQATMIVVLVLVTFLLTWSLTQLKTRLTFLVELYGFLVVVALVTTTSVLAVILFQNYHYVLSVTSAFAAIIGGYAVSTVYHLVSERRQRFLIKSMFSTYLNPTVVDELVVNPAKLVLGGKREELTVLFSDIEGFTTISQHMEPERVVSLLNEYLSEMSSIVFKHNGTLDKYEGDAVMAFWGAPVPQSDHALRACLCSLEMQEAVDEINRQWKTEGKPQIRIRIGINTGEMVVGNLGGKEKFDYTVIGDSVNLASRLEGANREYRSGVMVSRRTYELVKHRILGRELDRITVKGRSEPVTVYELLQTLDTPVDKALTSFLTLYSLALEKYYRREWDGATQLFIEALRLRPDDYPAALHRSRIEAFAITPPPADWDGVFVMKTK